MKIALRKLTNQQLIAKWCNLGHNILLNYFKNNKSNTQIQIKVINKVKWWILKLKQEWLIIKIKIGSNIIIWKSISTNSNSKCKEYNRNNKISRILD